MEEEFMRWNRYFCVRSLVVVLFRDLSRIQNKKEKRRSYEGTQHNKN
jgi:hypothetical protein